MKTKTAFTRILVATTIILMSVQTFAQDSIKGGGDPCKTEINKVRTLIQNWIIADDAKKLDFSKAKVPNLNYEIYKSKMLPVLEEGKVVVTCYLDPALINDPASRALAEKEGLAYKAITMANASLPPLPVACNNYEDGQGISHIDCDYQRVMLGAGSGKHDFAHFHHEYASVAGMELRMGGHDGTLSYTSDTSLSDQLGEFDQVILEHILGPKKGSSSRSPLDGLKMKTEFDSLQIELPPIQSQTYFLNHITVLKDGQHVFNALEITPLPNGGNLLRIKVDLHGKSIITVYTVSLAMNGDQHKLNPFKHKKVIINGKSFPLPSAMPGYEKDPAQAEADIDEAIETGDIYMDHLEFWFVGPDSTRLDP